VLAVGDWTRALRLWLHPGTDESEEDFWQRVAAAFGRGHEVQAHWPASRAHTILSRQAPRWLAAGGRLLRLATSSADLAMAWLEQDLFVAMPSAAFAALPAARRRELEAHPGLRLQWQPPTRLPAAKDREERQLQAAAVVNLAQVAAEVGAFAVEEFQRGVRRSCWSEPVPRKARGWPCYRLASRPPSISCCRIAPCVGAAGAACCWIYAPPLSGRHAAPACVSMTCSRRIPRRPGRGWRNAMASTCKRLTV